MLYVEKDKILNQLDNLIIPYREKLSMHDNTTFGVEIEAINALVPDFRNKYEFITFIDDYIKQENISQVDYSKCPWIIKPERTFLNERIRGSEIVSPILHNNREDYKMLKEICLLLKAKDAHAGYCTGGHIHFGTSSFDSVNLSSIIKLLKMWTVFEDVIYYFSTGEYTTIRPAAYQNAIPLRNQIIKELNEDKYLSLDDLLVRLGTIDNGLRLENLRKNRIFNLNKDTIEIRCPNGTLEHTIWQNNINFFYHLLNYTLSDKYDDEFINNMFNNITPSKGTIRKQIDNYMSLDIDKAIILGNLIFDDELDMLYYMKSMLKEESNEVEYRMHKVKKFYR